MCTLVNSMHVYRVYEHTQPRVFLYRVSVKCGIAECGMRKITTIAKTNTDDDIFR